MNFYQNHRTRKIAFWVFFTLFCVLLLCFAYKGFFSRYLQDDYCYGKTFRELGYLKGSIFPYFNATEYNGNRFSLTIFAALAEGILGTKGTFLYSLLSILGWLASLTFLINEVIWKLAKRSDFLLSLFIASLLLSFSFYLAPDLYQTLYWRNTSLTYLEPLIMNTALAAFILSQSRREKVTPLVSLVILLFSIVCAGFSEVTAVWQITIWAFLFLFNIGFIKNRESRKRNTRLILTVLAGAVIGAVLLIISPSNVTSLKGSSVNMASGLTLVGTSFRYGFDFLNYTLSGKWLPIAVLWVFGFLLVQFFNGEKSSLKKWARSSILIVLCTYLIGVACMMPSVLVRTAYPDPRALFVPHFTLMTAVFVLGVLAGNTAAVKKVFSSNKIPLQAASVLVFLALAAYVVRMIPFVVSDVPSLRARAIAWDQRQMMIFQQKAAGVSHIQIPAFDNIDQINELHLEEDHWVNQCAARYYGVDGISAIENYQGIKPYFH